MTNGAELERVIKDLGISIVRISEKMGCSRNRVYSIIKGADCTASEIVSLTGILHLTREQRDKIFLAKNVK